MGERLHAISEHVCLVYVCVSVNRINMVDCAKVLDGSPLWNVECFL